MAQSYTIDKDKLPTKLYSITFKEPTYGDYRAAKKRYPVERYAGDPAAKTSYSVEELLFAMCMERVDGQLLEQNPKDMAERLSPFPIPDRQFLMALFIEMFFLSREQAQTARDRADELLKAPSVTYKVDKSEVPSGERAFIFRAPNTGTQMEVDRRYQGPASGCSLEEMLFAFCLQSIDGTPVNQPKDIVSILDEWTIADVQYGSTLFINLFTIDDNQSQDAKKLAKELKESLKSEPVATTTKGTTTKA